MKELLFLFTAAAGALLGWMLGHFLRSILWKECRIHFPKGFAEIGSAFLFVLSVWMEGMPVAFDRRWTISAGILLLAGAAAMADVMEKRIPNGITAAVGIFSSAGFIGTSGSVWAEQLFGMLVAGGLLLAAAILSGGGLGGGDVKLAAALGLFLGSDAALRMLWAALFLAAVFCLWGLLGGRRSRKDEMALGPFFLAGTAVVLYMGI